MLIGPTGEIWVADGHRGGNNRIMKFSAGGELLLQLGVALRTPQESGLFNDPHDLKMDSQGRLFVADRGNNRIQIFSQKDSCSISGRNSEDRAVCGLTPTTRSTSPMACPVSNGTALGKGHPCWGCPNRYVTEFIPDYEIPNGSGIEFLASDRNGNIFAGQVGRQRFEKYIRVRP